MKHARRYGVSPDDDANGVANIPAMRVRLKPENPCGFGA
jgi:hypothetical protein